MDELASKLKKN